MTPGRPREFAPEEAVDAAMHVFWADGYESASLRNLLTATRLSRSSLYQTFDSKESLFLRCLGRYREELLEHLHEALRASPSGKAFIAETFHSAAREAGSRQAALGCLIFNSANELGHRPTSLSQQVNESMARITGIFRMAVARAQEEGDIPATHDTDALADYLVGAMGGLRTLLKSGMDEMRACRLVDTMLRPLE